MNRSETSGGWAHRFVIQYPGSLVTRCRAGMSFRARGCMRQASAALILGLAIGSMSPSARATEPGSQETVSATPAIELTAEEQAWLAANRTIVMGLPGEFEPAFFQRPDGAYDGIVIDLLDLIMSRIGLEIEVKNWPITELLPAVRNGELDGTLAAAILAAETFGLPRTRPYLQAYLTVFAGENLDRSIEGMNDLSGLRVAYLEGVQVVLAALAPLGDDIERLELESSKAALHAVFEGRADVMVGVNFDQYSINKDLLTGMSVAYVDWNRPVEGVMAVRPDAPELATILDKGLASISLKERNSILARWIPPEAIGPSRPALTLEERAWLREHPVVRVGVDPDWKPIEFADRNGIHRGVTADYLRRIEELLDIRIEAITGPTWQEVQEQAQAREIDGLSCVAWTEERAGYLEFTDSYLALPIVIFTRDDVPYMADPSELTGRRVVVVEGYAVQDWLARDHPGIELVPVDTTEQAFHMLGQGRADACLEAILPGGTAIAELGYTNIKVSGETPYVYDQRMGVRKDWPVFAGILQKTLDAISPSDRNAMYQKWLAVRYEKSFDYALLWKVAGALAAIIGVIFMWNRILARQVRARTSELASANENLQRSEERYRTFFTRSHEGFWCFQFETPMPADLAPGAQVEWVFLHAFLEECNDIFARMYGYTSASELVGLRYVDLVGGDERVAREAIQMWIDGGFDLIGAEVRATTRSGGQKWFLTSGTSHFESGRVVRTWGTQIDITDQKNAQKELTDAHRLLEAVIEQSPIPMAVALPDGTLKVFNEAVLNQLGIAEDSDVVPGANLLSITPSWKDYNADGEFVPTAELPLARALRGRFSRNLKIRVVRGDGTERWEIVNGAPIYNDNGELIAGFVAFPDITDLKLAEDALRESEEKYRLLVENQTDLVVTLDTAGKIRFVSPSYCRLFGKSEEDLLGSTFDALECAEDPHHAASVMEEIQRPPHSTYFEQRAMTEEGWRWLGWVNSAVLDQDGNVASIISVGRDITERKEAEETLQTQMEMQKLLLSELDHRVRNNLSSMLSLIDLSRTSAGSVEDLASSIRSRMQAIASVHSVLSRTQWRGTDLGGMVRSLIQSAPHDRVNIDGPPVVIPLSQSQALGLVLNELITNSAKHGALSVDGGVVDVSWSTQTAEDGQMSLTLDWREHGGPPIEAHPAPGTGTNLIIGLTKSELCGQAVLTFPSSGVEHRFHVRLATDATARFSQTSFVDRR